jgi:uridine kinase
VAQVIVLAGPSGAGKSRLAERLGLPVLRLDDFYKDVGDPTLPLVDGRVDWDDASSWHSPGAMTAIRELCATGTTEIPVYDIPTSRRVGTQVLELGGAPAFVAEGIFAHHVVADCRDEGLLAAAYCITQRPVVTFWRRLVRDLREHRKPPPLLLRRGVALMRAQRALVARIAAAGCPPMTGDEAFVAIRRLPAMVHPS